MTYIAAWSGKNEAWRAMMDERWHPINLAPVGEQVWTKIDDEHGERNVAQLTRRGNLWFTEPDGRGMYVYYTPTHWHR